jgi:predicted RNA polymerase sigma factor
VRRAIAAAMVHGPAEGLRLLAKVSPQLPGHHRLDGVRAHLLEEAGELAAAGRHYRVAAARTASTPERHHLTVQAARHLQHHRSGVDRILWVHNILHLTPYVPQALRV